MPLSDTEFEKELNGGKKEEGHGNIDPDALREFLERYKDHEVSLGITLDNLTGGLGDKITIAQALEKFDFEQLHKGVNVELEHTNNVLIALEIAVDHLVENDKYYDYLEDMEKEMEESRGVNSGYGGANTGGTRSSVGRVWPNKRDFDDEEDLESNLPDETPGKLKKSNIYQPILKEPADHLRPRAPKGPGD